MSIVRNTVSKVGREQKSITIKVNPVDLKLVKETMRTDSQLSEAVEVLVFEDAEVDPGSCVIETRAGQIDARFSTQLGILKQLLLTGGKA
jgi:flagellar biosynthesis/type III secretory pathway protein FliH